MKNEPPDSAATIQPVPGTNQSANPQTFTYRSHSIGETLWLAQRIAAVVEPGQTIALIGDLGAGKTAFVKGFVESLGVPIDEVNSPTFSLVQEYNGRLTIRHCDTYRLKRNDEFLDLSLDELFANDSIALIEWADRVLDYLPRDLLTISIEIVTPEERLFTIDGKGRRSSRILDQLWQASSQKR